MSEVYRTDAGGRAVRERYRAVLERWPVPAERVRLNTRAGETFVLVSGPVDGPPVVALHGSGGNATTWMADITTWAPHLRVYAVDVIGEPGLSAAVRPELGSAANAEWLDDVLDGLGVDSPAVLGMSLGGWLAVDYASRRPSRVSRLALLAPGGVGRRRYGWVLRALPFFALGAWGRRRVVRIVTGVELGAVASSIGETFGEFKPRTDIPVFPDDVLERLTMPVLAVVGDRDAMIDSAMTARRLAALVPHADVRVVPGGHLLLGQADAVLGFLR
ncbi:alpha/beta fold hydrolase [Umezawaea endophytica]|uniref:Alpha/beta fold hydrolase n=1 Tax=Umezawaea endophytica TaxID=1654476 RepID=A0A9X2VP55_9PSEU|nr:alpha/beta fold hydrolase [Umezawaea endophytica]MCS7479602.1 alpha/beta fold hydrolase [Umezawaea endophytica]